MSNLSHWEDDSAPGVNNPVGGRKVAEDATYWDYSADEDECPDCGEPKRKVSTRCQSCDADFRARAAANFDQFKRGLVDYRAGKRVVLRFNFND